MPNAISWWANSVLSTLLAVGVAWIAISFDRRKTVNQELIRKRLAIYDLMAPKLNDILCFFCCIGDFKRTPPPTLIGHKRELDRTIHVYQPIFSSALKASYDRFSGLCFIPYGGGRGRPALIRANFEWLAIEWEDDWQGAWSSGFVRPKEASDLDAVRASYDAMMAQFARELGADRGGMGGRRS